MNKILKKVIYSIFGLILMCVLVSCPNPLIEKNKGSGELSFILPSRNNSNNNSKNNVLTFKVNVTSKDINYNYQSNTTEGETIVLDKLKSGNYIININAEDDEYIYEFKKEVALVAGQKVEVDVVFNPIRKGGQLSLYFKNIKFDNSLTFNVLVKDINDKEVFSDNNVSVQKIINDKYTLSPHFPVGDYKIYITGGNIDKEQYVVNTSNFVKVEEGKNNVYIVLALPYKTIYVDGNKNNSSEDSGSEQNPTHSVHTALNKIKDYTDPVKIIIRGTVTVSSPIILNEGLNITFEGENGGKIVGEEAEVLKIEGALVTLKNIEISNKGETNSIIFNKGSLTIDKNVFIEDVQINNGNTINVNKPLLQNNNTKYTTVYLPEYLENTKVFNLCFDSLFNNTYIKTGNQNFFIDERGYCQQVLKDLSIKLTNIEDSNTEMKDISYKVLEGETQIVPSTSFDGCKICTIPDLKAGVTYNIEVSAKCVDKTNYSLYDTKPCYIKKISKSITIDPKSNDKNGLLIDCIKEGQLLTGNILLHQSNLSTAYCSFPLNVTLTGTGANKDIITKTIVDLDNYINYIPAGTYNISISSGKYDEKYKLTNSNIIITDNATTECSFSVEMFEPPIYYVGYKSGTTNAGTVDNPFDTFTEAFNTLKDKNESVILVVTSEITQNTKILLDNNFKPINFTLVCNNIPKIITADSGLFTINNPNLNVTIKNMKIEGDRLTTDDTTNLIDLQSGHLSLQEGVELANSAPVTGSPSTVTPVSLIKVSSTALLDVSNGFSTTNGYVLLDSGAKIRLLNNFTQSATPSIKIKAVTPSEGLSVVEASNPKDITILKENLSSYAPCVGYFDNSYKIDENGKLYIYYKVSDLDSLSAMFRRLPDKYNEANPFNMPIFVQNNDELIQLGKKIREFPQNSIALTLKTSPEIKTIDKSIFNYDLQGCQSILSLTIENGITYIEDNAFSNCHYLKSITLGEGLESIGCYAFDNCSSLIEVNLPKSLESIGDYAFAIHNHSGQVLALKIGDKIRQVGKDSLTNRGITCTQEPQTSYLWRKIESSSAEGSNFDELSEENGILKNVLDNSYSGEPGFELNKIVSVSEAIPIIEKHRKGVLDLSVSVATKEELTSLATAIKTVQGEGVELYISDTNTTINEIPQGTFKDCAKLLKITVPFKIKTIGANAFSGTSIKSFNVFANHKSYSSLTYISLPWKLTDGINEIIIEKNVTPEEKANNLRNTYATYTWNAPYNGEEINQMLGTGANPSLVPQTLFAYLIEDNLDQTWGILENLKKYNGKLDFSISDEIQEISGRTFDSAQFTSIILPRTLKIIGPSAFINCTSLTEVTIPPSVIQIGADAFANVTALTSAIFKGSNSKWLLSDASSSTVTEFIPSSNYKVNAEKLQLPSQTWDKVLNVSEAKNAISYYNKLYQSTPVNNVNLAVATENQTELATLGRAINNDIPNVQNDYGQDEPKYFVNLSLFLNGENKTISSEFNDISLENPTKIPSGCVELSSINIMTKGVTIESGAFMNCTQLEKVNFDETSIVKGGAFTGCDKLQYSNNLIIDEWGNIFIKNEQNEINSWNGINFINIPPKVTSIAEYAFYGCNNAGSLTIPDNLESIGNYAFANCNNLNSLSFGSNPKITTLSTGVFYKSGLSSINSATLECFDLSIPQSITTIMPGALYTDTYATFDITNSLLNIKFADRLPVTWVSDDNIHTFTIEASDEQKQIDSKVQTNLIKATVIDANGVPTGPTFTKQVQP